MGLPTPVISSGGIMLRETISQNRYSYDESRNLSCFREYRAFFTVLSVVRPSEAYIWEISRLYLTFYFYILHHYGAYHRSR